MESLTDLGATLLLMETLGNYLVVHRLQIEKFSWVLPQFGFASRESVWLEPGALGLVLGYCHD